MKEKLPVVVILFFIMLVYPVAAIAAEPPVAPDYQQMFEEHGEYEGENALFSMFHDMTAKAQMDENQKSILLGVIIAGSVLIFILFALTILLFAIRRKTKKAMRAVENYAALVKTFIEADENMVYLKDENLRYVFLSRTVGELYHKSVEEIVGKDDYEISEKEFADKRRQTDLAVLKKSSLIIDEIDWNGRVYQTTKFPVKMMNGATGVGAYVRDVTKEREDQKRQTQTSNRNKILADVLSQSFKSTEEQLDYVLHRCLDLTESQYGYIYLYDEDKSEFTLSSWTEGVMEACSVAAKQVKYQHEATGIWGEAVRLRKAVVINNFEAPNPLKKGYPAGHVHLNKFMSIPVIADGRIVAVVGLGNKKDDYDINDIYETTLLINGVWHDIEKRSAQENLSYERNKYLQTLISIGDGVMVVDKDGKIEMLNRVAERLTGWPLEEARGRYYKDVFRLSHENQSSSIEDPIEGVFKTNEIQEMGNNVILISKDGSTYYLEDSAAPIKDEAGEKAGVVLVFRDVTEKKEQRKKIEFLSFHDALTGLYNRRFFEEELIRINTKSNLPISIVMGDVNGLKLTNDIFGHEFGDLLLKSVSQVLGRVCRSDDIVARWGGDEFVLLLPKTTTEEAQTIIARIKDEFSREQVKAIKGSISMGVDTKYYESENISVVLTNAEQNMYAAKTLERDEVKSDVVRMIISTLHENSDREKEHSQRVSDLSLKLGKAMNLSEKKLRQLKDAAYLHDIGKIVLDPQVLNKNHGLSKEEWNEVKRHPIIGFRILNSFDDTLDLAEPVLAHQERWDGLGYPKGLKGEEIPVVARIIAVAESYDRMTHDSENKKAINIEQAIQVMRENAGTQFDPQLALMLVDIIKKEFEKASNE